MQTSLYYKAGGSDKVYQVQTVKSGGGYVVNFQYGRRGSTLIAGTKTSSPVSEAEADRIFARLIHEKKLKGYTEDASGTPYVGATDKQSSGVLPQLLNEISEDEAQKLILDPDYCAQEKMNGHHKLIRKTGDKIEGINKKGLIAGLPEIIVKAAGEIGGGFILDGEQIGDTFQVFDCLELDGEDLRGQSWLNRMSALNQYDLELADGGRGCIKLVPTAFTTAEKRALWNRLKKQNREGIVFKRTAAPFTAGRPNSGGDMFKHKFWATLSAVVHALNLKSSVQCVLKNGGEWVSCGNVTIPADAGVKPSDIIEIRYLYAHKSSGNLYQPVFMGIRNDVSENECTTSQLKFKPEDE